MQANFSEFYGPPPTYIKNIHPEDDPITLVYGKPNQLLKVEESVCPDVSLDLTGNPLIVDLKYDANLSIAPNLNSWTETELSHFPLNLDDARKVINEFNKRNKYGNTSPIYCVCDGSDNKRTVVLGSHVYVTEQIRKFIRIVITVAGYFSENDPKLSLEYMQKEHQKETYINNLKLDAVVTNRYVLYGTDLKNYSNLNDAEFSGSIHVEVSWDKFQYVLPTHVKSMQVTLQVIIGHKDSKLYNFWKELRFLNKCITILKTKDANSEDIAISNEPEVYTKIIVDLCKVLNDGILQRPIPRDDIRKSELNMNDLREYNLLDKLWTLLIHCHKIEDLKICLHTLFEELAKSRVNIFILDNSCSVISKIIDKLSTGKIAVPTLTRVQALECLVELGIEKLKNDYFYIIDHFDSMISRKLNDYWDKVAKESEAEHDELHVQLHYSHLPLCDINNMIKKYNFLTHINTALEFLFLTKYFATSTQETLVYLTKCILNQYLSVDDSVDELQSVLSLQLRELKISLNSTNSNFVQLFNPISRNLKLSTNNKTYGVTTVFHQSKQPVFPPTIYNSYDISVNGEEDLIFYCYKSVTYWNNV